ncbi:response regulator, partial [Methylobrevis pamukkalensis]|uniref:response regulator n=1 Tax=Methylobrevis pamukkalensis TaxID=1439726 RepID=UPI000845F340
MIHHSSYGLPAEFLDIIVIEDSKPMQMMMRSMLSGLHARRIRCFESAEDALEAMLAEPPNLIITDWRLPGMSGYQLLRTIRMKQMAPLSFVPLLVLSAHATRAAVERALRAGANHFLVKPVSPACVVKWVERTLKDARRFKMTDTGHYVIDGVEEALSSHRGRHDTLARARIFHDRSFRRIVEAQTEVDRILARSLPDDVIDGAPPAPVPRPAAAPATAPTTAPGGRYRRLAPAPEPEPKAAVTAAPTPAPEPPAPRRA